MLRLFSRKKPEQSVFQVSGAELREITIPGPVYRLLTDRLGLAPNAPFKQVLSAVDQLNERDAKEAKQLIKNLSQGV